MFADRLDAGHRLARELDALRGRDVVVLGLPCGGVPVAAAVAEALDAPLDVVVVRKLGLPTQPELAMGAIAEGGLRLVDTELTERMGIDDAELGRIERRERAVLDARAARLRHGRRSVPLAGRVAVIVDDGMATGSSVRVACAAVRLLRAARVDVAVPVAPALTVRELTEADAVVCVSIPQRFVAVGRHYLDFAPVGEDEVIELLDAAARRIGNGHSLSGRAR
ncbi:MAG TPA: phosphoribosyltransferase family protein [Jatrophihabitans sp.]|uniref:phosphoribosyltransferase n=1 Tax=Jatrophihabitans sp. TaxID=1932789 RepID=UPI002E05FDC9|nr:phosphoribosyltransferase family protein [Jatrophihabitans sp.]